jgi:hypothetical protein
VPNQSEFAEICSRAGLAIADSTLGVGRELTYCEGPVRIIVIHFVEADFPEVWKKTMMGILSLEAQWILMNRHGHFQARQYGQGEVETLLDLLIQRYPKVIYEGDDQYLVSKEGNVVVSYDHHMLDDGLAVYTNAVSLASKLLCRLNEMGVELELFSKNG